MPWQNALEELMRYVRGGSEREPLAGQAPVWDWDNPVGTETLSSMRSGCGAWWDAHEGVVGLHSGQEAAVDAAGGDGGCWCG